MTRVWDQCLTADMCVITESTHLWGGVLCVIILLIVVAIPCSSLVIAPRGVIARIGRLLVLVVLVVLVIALCVS